MEEAPTHCPQCKNLLKIEEYGKCESCQGKVLLGVKRCPSCKLSKDPSYTGPTPGVNPGVTGGLN